jgi:hypothetical protein
MRTSESGRNAVASVDFSPSTKLVMCSRITGPASHSRYRYP